MLQVTVVAILLMGLLGAGTGLAHEDTKPQPRRELVRLQGYLAEPPAGAPIVRTIALVVLAQEHRFHATDWQRFGFRGKDDAAAGEEPAQTTLHGDRPALHRLATARPDQRLTILAERRVGSADLFLLTLDLCPPD